MKKVLTVTTIILLFACLTQGFTTPGNVKQATTTSIKNETTEGTAPRFYHSKWQNSTWVKPFYVGPPIHIHNHFAANVDVAYAKYGHRSDDPIISGTNITSGDQGGGALSYDYYYGTIVLSINALADSQTGMRSIFIEDFSGTRHCHDITGSGEYTFSNLASLTNMGIWIYIEVTNCD